MKKINLVLGMLGILFLVVFTDCSNAPINSIESFDVVSIKFDNQGQGKPTLILIHGWSNNRSIWEAQVAHFSKAHQVIAVDLPGFGESGNNRNNWTMENFGKDISEIILQLKLDDVIVVGFSMGAPVALEAARQVPEKISGVILVDDIQQIEMNIPPHVAQVIDSIMMDLVNFPTKEKMVLGGFFKHNTEESTKKIIGMLENHPRIGWQESLQAYINWSNESCTDAVKNVKAPIIAINSDMKPTNIEAFKQYAPSFNAKIVKDVGHAIMLDKPDEFNRLLEECILEFMK